MVVLEVDAMLEHFVVLFVVVRQEKAIEKNDSIIFDQVIDIKS